MKYVAQVCLIVVAAALTAAAAIHHGKLTNRWGPSSDMAVAQGVMESLPRDFGPWHRQEPIELGAYEQKTLQCAGYLSGVYVNPDLGASVQVSSLLGPPGPMSVHRPEICFSAVNFPQESERKRVVIPLAGTDHSAWMVQFRDLKDAQRNLKRVYYAWSDGGAWTADEAPRITFGTSPYLFKVQVVVEIPEEAGQSEDDAAKAFLREFIPAFDKQATEKIKTPAKQST